MIVLCLTINTYFSVLILNNIYMNILFVSSESMPYCKTGGLADVVFGMAKELNRQGHDTRIIIPCYRGILNREIMEKVVAGLRIPLGSYSREADIWKTNKDAKHLRFYLIQQEYYFGRDNYYGYLDDYERFIFFSRAVFELLCNSSFEKNESDWFPDIIQG
jgi:starch synthase